MAGVSSRQFRKWMYDTPLLEAQFSLGVVRDLPRSLIPPGGAYDLQDYLIDQPGKLYKRGGSSFASSVVGAADSMVILVGIACPEFPGDPRVVVIGSDGASTRKLYDVTTGTPASAVTISRQPVENPSFFVDKLIVTEGYSAAVVPKKVYLSAGTVAVADLGGSPPAARYSCAHLGRLVLANNDTNQNRLWFSPVPTAGQAASAGIENTWNPDSHYIDVPAPITGLASVSGVLIVFMRGSYMRILGSVPPGYGTSQTPTDMQLQPGANVGCIDARSIVYSNGLVYFAHESGIYYTNGAAPASLTTKDDGSGISTLWRSYTADLDPVLGAVVASGIYSNDWMKTSIRHPSGPDVTFLCYLPTGRFSRVSINNACDMYASRSAPHAQLYGANAATTEPVRPLSFSSFFTPSATYKNDADGTAVTPLLETRMIGTGPGMKAYGDAHITYDMRDSASDNPTMSIQVSKGIEASSYSTVAESPLTETTDAARKRFTVSKDAQAVNFKFQQTNASSKTEIYAIEASERPYWVADGQ